MRKFCALLASPILLAACSSEPLGNGDSPSTKPKECASTPYASNPDPQYVGTVKATVLGLDAQAPEDLLIQVCGMDLCTNGETAADGSTSVSPNHDMRLPAFKYGDGLTYGKVAIALPEPTDHVDLGEVYIPQLPSSGDAIQPGRDAISGGVTLSVAEGADTTFDRLTYRTDDEQAFRAAELPLEFAPNGLDAELDLEVFFALAPLDTEFCPPAALSVPNTLGWEPGTPVEFFIQGLDTEELYAPYAGFAKVADGVVTDAGDAITTTDGGLPVLSLVGVRQRP